MKRGEAIIPISISLITTPVALCGLLLCTSVSAQSDPAQTLRQLKVAEGLEISLFAAEPDLRNPTSIDVDAQGRVWVLEAANYRLFNQSMEDPNGDRIRILEDTDGDGRCDKATTFYQDPSLQAPLGIAVLGDRVYICQSPDLFYLEDTDGDGKADKKIVILTGFKGIDHDHAIHGIQFGPDGYLYMSNGDQGLDVTDKSGNRVHAGPGAPLRAATVLRTDMEGRHLEVLASNMRNPYEPTVDSFGNVFISDNDDDGNEQTRINYVMEGGDYGYWSRDTGSRRKGNRRLDRVHWNADRPGTAPTMLKTGFGSPTGMFFYEGNALPSRLHRTIIHSDAGPGHIRSYRPIPDGAGFSAEMEVLVSSPEDFWFRPSDVVAAPDGSIFIADWYDAGVGGHRMVDARLGRIYRLTKKGSGDSYNPPPLDLTTSQGLSEAFTSPNQARHYLAYAALASRPAEESQDFLTTLLSDDNPVARARAFWLLAQQKDLQDKIITTMISDADPENRVMAVRAWQRFASHLTFDGVGNDPHPAVRRQMLLETAFNKESEALQVPDFATLQVAYDGQDRFYREALGIAVREFEVRAFDIATRLHGNAPWNANIAGLALQYHPPSAYEPALKAANNKSLPMEVRTTALRAIEAIADASAGSILVHFLTEDSTADLRTLAMELLTRDEGDTWREAVDSEELRAHLAAKLNQNTADEQVFNFIRQAKVTSLTGDLVFLAAGPNTAHEVREATLDTLASTISRAPFEKYDDWTAALTPLLNHELEDLQAKTIQVVARMRGAEPRAALQSYLLDLKHPRAPRLEALRALLRSKAGAKAILQLAHEEELPEDLMFSASESLHASRYDDIKAKAARLLPREETRSGEALPALNDLLRRTGDPVKGKAVFLNEETASCTRCHAIDEAGTDIGPNLAKIGEKLSRRSLFESILAPSAAISHEYQAWIVDTKSERGLTGYIRSENSSAIELVDSSAAIMEISTDHITAREKSPISVMPSNLASAMTTQELVDLVAYLETLK